jgi:spore germination protein KC
MTTEEPRRIFIGQVRILVFGEEFARKGVTKVMDFFARDAEISANLNIIVSRGTTAEKILQILTAIEKVPAVEMISSLEATEQSWASIKQVKLDDLLENLMSDAKQAALPAIEIKGDPNAGEIKDHTDKSDLAAVLHYTGMAVFKHDKLAGWLKENESQAYNLITRKIKNSVIQIECPSGGVTSVRLQWTKNKIRGSMVNGNPFVTIRINGEGNVGESQCPEHLKNPKTVTELRKMDK